MIFILALELSLANGHLKLSIPVPMMTIPRSIKEESINFRKKINGESDNSPFQF